MNTNSNREQVVLPGRTIGVLGGGQLGRMMAIAARTMGYRIVTLDPTPDSPCGQAADEQIVAPYTDIAAARQLAEKADVVTYEFENVDVAVTSILETESWVPQGSQLLHTTKHRIREKDGLQSRGIPVTPFRGVSNFAELQQAGSELGYPLVLKTTTGGYDGKGQWLIKDKEALTAAWTEAKDAASRPMAIPDSGSSLQPHPADAVPLVAEQFVRFVKELSVVVARNGHGETRAFPVAENIHENHILHLSIVPARIAPGIADAAMRLGIQVAEALNVVGLVAVEMFLGPDGEIYVNELAPRPHNSGHYTQDACVTSQFEQHVRAICNLPLGRTDLLEPVVMVNILGEHMHQVLAKVPSLPDNMKLHLYGKHEGRRGRKMGHINVLSDSVERALADLTALNIWSIPTV